MTEMHPMGMWRKDFGVVFWYKARRNVGWDRWELPEPLVCGGVRFSCPPAYIFTCPCLLTKPTVVPPDAQNFFFFNRGVLLGLEYALSVQVKKIPRAVWGGRHVNRP